MKTRGFFVAALGSVSPVGGAEAQTIQERFETLEKKVADIFHTGNDTVTAQPTVGF